MVIVEKDRHPRFHIGAPIYWSLRAFKGVYYLTSLTRLRRCFAAWRRRKRAIKEVTLEVPARVQS